MRRPGIIAWLIGTCLSWNAPASAAEVTHDFRSRGIDKKLFRPVSPNATRFLSIGESGLLIRLPSKAEVTQPVGLTTRFGVSGDFEVTVAFDGQSLEAPTQGRGAGVGIWFAANNAGSEAATLSWLTVPGGQRLFSAHHALTSKSGVRDHSSGPPLPTAATTGRLRLVRNEKTLSYLIAAGSNREFREIHQVSCGHEPIPSIRIALDPGGGSTPMSVRLLWMHVKWDDSTPAIAEATPSWPWVTLAPAIAASTAAAVFLYRRRVKPRPA